MAFGIRALAFANGEPFPHAGEWLAAFDHNAFNGLGHGTFTTDPARAMRFANKGDAWSFWNRASTVKPRRADGRPNKPLTATHIVIEELP